MKTTVKIKYYKKSRRGREPIKFSAYQPGGVGTDITVTLKADPILKEYPELRAALFRHEIDEITAWGRGERGTHKKARSKEPRAIRNIGGVSGFWKYIDKKEKGKEIRVSPRRCRITPKTPRLR